MNKIKAFLIAVILLAVVFAVLAGVKGNQIVMMIESGYLKDPGGSTPEKTPEKKPVFHRIGYK